MRLLIAAALLLAAPALAQPASPPETVKYISAQALDQALMTPEKGKVYSGHVVDRHDTYWSEFMKRFDHGNVIEYHAHWYDYITVLSGDGSVTYGGTVTGATGTDEQRGGTMTGGTVQVIKPGDYIQIPPGVPHIINAAPGQTLRFVIFKHKAG